jgi:hypothetical protein
MENNIIIGLLVAQFSVLVDIGIKLNHLVNMFDGFVAAVVQQ